MKKWKIGELEMDWGKAIPWLRIYWHLSKEFQFIKCKINFCHRNPAQIQNLFTNKLNIIKIKFLLKYQNLSWFNSMNSYTWYKNGFECSAYIPEAFYPGRIVSRISWREKLQTLRVPVSEILRSKTIKPEPRVNI